MTTTRPSTQALDRPMLRQAQPPADLRPAERYWLIAGVAAAHLVGLWGLMQLDVVQPGNVLAIIMARADTAVTAERIRVIVQRIYNHARCTSQARLRRDRRRLNMAS